MKSTSLVILDLKEIDPERHRQLTGKDNANILAMSRHISDLGIPLWIRHVLVPGLTDDEEGLRMTADCTQQRHQRCSYYGSQHDFPQLDDVNRTIRITLNL